MANQLYAIATNVLSANTRRISLCSPERAGVSWSEIRGLAAHLGVLTRVEIRVFQAGADLIVEQTWDEGRRTEATLRHILRYEIPNCVLFMGADVFPTFEAACRNASIALGVHHYPGVLAT